MLVTDRQPQEKHIPELDGPMPSAPAIQENTPLVLDLEKLKFIETEATTGELLKTAATLVVASAEEYTKADDFLRTVRKARNSVKARISAFLDKNIKKAKDLHQSLCDDRTAQQDEHERPLADIEVKVIGLMRAFEEKVKADNKRIQDEAAAKAKKEREDAAKKAEDDRQAQLKKDQEERAKETLRLEELRKSQEETAKTLAAQGRSEEAAAALRTASDLERQAEAVIAAPPPTPVPAMPPPPSVEPLPMSHGYGGGFVPKSKALGGRKDYTWTGKDKMALIKAAAQNPEAFAQFLDFNDATLSARAKSLKAEAGKLASGEAFPGVEFSEKQINAVRG